MRDLKDQALLYLLSKIINGLSENAWEIFQEGLVQEIVNSAGFTIVESEDDLRKLLNEYGEKHGKGSDQFH